MKRIFTFALAAVAALSVSAARRTVWTGNEPISWNSEAYKGSQFETPSGILSDLIVGDTIQVSYNDGIENPQYVLTYKAGKDWDWTDLAITIEDGKISYIVASQQIATEIAERGLIFRGQGYNITSIIIAEVNNDDPDWKETTVWSGENFAISWDNKSWEGTYFDTYGNAACTMPTLKKDYVIRAYVAAAENDAQYTLVYKAGEDWGTWTDLNVSLTRGVLSATIPSDEVAQLIYDRGLVVTGIKYYINKITIYAPKGGSTGIDNSSANFGGSQKILRDGQLYILYNGAKYNVHGQVIK
jgi:hypothetical protein